MKEKYTKINCEKCGILHEVLSTTLYKRKYKNRPNYCKKCMKEYSIQKKKDYYNNLPQEEKDKYSQRTKDQLAKRSAEEQAIINKKNSQSNKKRWSKISKEEKINHMQKMHKGRDAYFKNQTDEEKERMKIIHSKNRKNYWSKISLKDRRKMLSKATNVSIKNYNNLSENEKKIRLQPFRDGHKKHFENMTDEEKKLHSELRREIQLQFWDNLTDEEYIEQCIKTSEGQKNRISNMSKEERMKHNEILHNNHMKWRAKLTPEDIELLLQPARIGYKKWYNSLSEEEKEIINKNKSDKMILYHKNMSIEEKDRLNRKYKDHWGNMTVEEYNMICENRKQIWKNKSLDSKDNIIHINLLNRSSNIEYTNTELEFINILNLNNIEFISQYTNETIYPDFHKLFPNNPVTESDYTSPYHAWDFKISTLQKDILVDIDGSIHNPNKTNSYVSRNGKQFSLIDFIQFNDSKRPYQTDGLDAYIIKCYNDNLYDKDVIVSNVQTNKDMNLNEFITLLNSYNMNDNEIKEMIKERIDYNDKMS